ncbi:MAG TPA: cytochrome c maturation protein CcmE [Anaerolineaceae bacterium]|nr:cytochrome c maturation protein CcmE [Anaerolineaceae bacterium]
MQKELIGKPAANGRVKFFIGGLLIVAAIVYLIATSLASPGGAQYFLTVDELEQKSAEMSGQKVRISGAVIGDTITYNPDGLTLSFEIAHVPADNEIIEQEGGLAAVLHQAVENPDANRLKVVYTGVKPDLLQHEAQAIATGELGEDGVFYADELLLKCPTKYEEAAPNQVGSSAENS